MWHAMVHIHIQIMEKHKKHLEQCHATPECNQAMEDMSTATNNDAMSSGKTCDNIPHFSATSQLSPMCPALSQHLHTLVTTPDIPRTLGTFPDSPPTTVAHCQLNLHPN